MSSRLDITKKEKVDGDPFHYCKLGRKKYALVLTEILKNNDDELVLAINNKWGTGKTTFIKMWKDHLENESEEFKTIYFNAWENDFEDNPFVALLGEMKTLTTSDRKEFFDSLVSKAGRITKGIIPILLKSIAKRYIDIEEVTDILEKGAEGAVEAFTEDVDEYSSKKNDIEAFRGLLQEYIVKQFPNQKLIFFIDELDRCRPNYAVSILEQIKHFFSVQNIQFVLSIDKKQLKFAIQGVYGSADMDAEEYLRRFIDIEYSLPSPDTEKYYEYLYEINNLDQFFESNTRRQDRNLYEEKEDFLNTCEALFYNNKIELRKQEKMFALVKLSLSLYNPKCKINSEIYLFLIFLKIQNNELYNNIKNNKLSVEELHNKFYELVRVNNSEDTKFTLFHLEASLLKHYNSYNDNKVLIQSYAEIAEFDGYNFISKINEKVDKERNISEKIFRDTWYDNNLLKNTFNKIELLEGVNL